MPFLFGIGQLSLLKVYYTYLLNKPYVPFLLSGLHFFGASGTRIEQLGNINIVIKAKIDKKIQR